MHREQQALAIVMPLRSAGSYRQEKRRGAVAHDRIAVPHCTDAAHPK